MKTQKSTTGTLPSPMRFSLYLLAVAVICFLNWNALKASDHPSNKSFEERLAEALEPVADPEPELEAWMLTFNLEYRLAQALEPVADPEPKIEGWMLNPSYGQFAETGIELESWMIDRLEFYTITNPENEPTVEDWMVNTSSWTASEFIAKK